MKKTIAIILATIIFLVFSISFAEDIETDYSDIIPNYEEMLEKRVLIGKNRDNIEIYEFTNQNFIYDYSGYYRLMRPSEVLTELERRGIQFTGTTYTTVYTFEFFVVTLIDGSSYGLEILRTYDDQEYIPEDSFRKLCQYYFGFEYDYSGV